MSKNILLILMGSLLLFSLPAMTQEQEENYQDKVLVSDLDDTLKITNHSASLGKVYRSLFSTKVFAGMDTLYQIISDRSSDFYILSASPNLIRSRVKRLLRKRGLSHAKVILKRSEDGETYDYKVNALEDILEESEDQLILIGDDTSHDPEAYDYIAATYPERITAVYIHTVVGREIPESAIPFWSAYDIAISEYQAGRLSLDEAIKVGEKIVSTRKDKKIHPKFVVCPDSFERIQAYNIEIKLMQDKVYSRLEKICQKRD
jgi:phosphatidate phosphatase APP1